MTLPPGWTLATLPALVGLNGLFIDGDWIESKDQDPNGEIRLTQLADVGDGIWRDRSNRFLTKVRAEQLGCTFLNAEDVLIARMADPLGRACIFPGDSKQAVTAVDVCVVRPAAEINPRWLMYFINAQPFRRQVEALQKGTTRKRISRLNLSKIPIPVPPKPEQDRIVAAIEKVFSHLDAGIESLERARRNLQRLTAALLQGSVEGCFDDRGVVNEPDTETHRRPLPDGWSGVAVEEVADVQGGITKNPRRLPASNAFPFLRVANVGRGRLDLTEIHHVELFAGELDRYRLQAGDLLVVEGNGSPDQIGRSALWSGQIDPCVHQNHLIRIRPGAELIPEYLNLFWNSPGTRARLRHLSSSTSGLYTLSTGKVRSFVVALPPLPEQDRIVRTVSSYLSLIGSCDSTLDHNQRRGAALRRSVLHHAFQGRLVPQDPAEEPGSALLERLAASSKALSPRVDARSQPGQQR